MSDLSRRGLPEPPQLDAWTDEPFDAAELLTHNPSNAVTGGIWRVHRGGETSIAKVITAGSDHAGPAGWAASHDPTHFNYWRREVEVYESDLPLAFADDGIAAPNLLRVDEPDAETVVLWLEDAHGRSAGDLTVDDLVDFAFRLGRAQAGLTDGGRNAELRRLPWLSRDFLSTYPESKYEPAVLEAALRDDRAWSHPLVDHHLGPLRDGIARLHRQRQRLYDLATACPRTLSHLDVWPSNIIRDDGGLYRLVDWSFCGDGAVGEDIANLIPDAFFDLLLPHEQLDDLARRAEDAYVGGLREGAWGGDVRWVQLGIRASAAKYHWLFKRLVTDPDAPAVVYGGREVTSDDLYAARAAGLALLLRWIDEAFDLATELGVDV